MTVGLQHSYYSSEEDSGLLQVCVEVLSGQLDGRTVSLSYSSIDAGNKTSYVLLDQSLLPSKRYFHLLGSVSDRHTCTSILQLTILDTSLLLFFSAPGDFTEAIGTLSVTDDNPVQCVEVTIVNDIEDEDEMECFALSISPLTSTDGVTLDTTHATICITDDDGEFIQ